MNSGHAVNICGENEKLQVWFELLCNCEVQFIILIPPSMEWLLVICYSFEVGFQTKLKDKNMCHVNVVNEKVSLEWLV